MAGKRQAEQPPERRIIRRSRLLAALSATDARTILLIAPAGYGKTTLARQWLEETGGVWVTVTEASADIAVLAGDLVTAVSGIATIESRRIETAFSVGNSPIDQGRGVARALLGQIPARLMEPIVIDDYHLLMRNRGAETLIATLERSGRFRFLITSRERPAWATPRRRVYMETVEFGAGELALDDGEVAQLLPPDRRTASLRAQARGWPAALGLAAYLSSTDVPMSADALSASLYDFFAEELFYRTSRATQDCLGALSVLPPLTAEQLSAFVGSDDAASQVVATGLAYESDEYLEVHPLARDFLLEKLKSQPNADEVSRTAFDFALDHQDYHRCFVIITEFGLDDCLDRLITTSYAALVGSGRINTLEQFGQLAAESGRVPNRLTDLISAEVALVRSEFVQARSLGSLAAEAFDDHNPLKARGLLIAGRAAYFLYRFEEAFDLNTKAADQALSADDLNEAVWGRCLAAFALEDARMPEVVRELEGLPELRPADRVRLEIARHQLATLGGVGGSPIPAVDGTQLISCVVSPWVRSSWGYTRGAALLVAGQYNEAQLVLEAALAELDEANFSFGRPHGEWSLAGAELGRRRFFLCDRRLRRLERAPSYASDLHTQINVRALRARMLLAEHRALEAVQITSDDFPRCPTRAMYGEYLGTRALALSVAGEGATALAAASQAEDITRSVYTKVLGAAARAIVAQDDPIGAPVTAERLMDMASELEVWDPVVCAVRASIPLALRLAGIPRHNAELRSVLLRANDEKLAKSLGLITRLTPSAGVLSRREREIMEQLKLGRKNAEIATSLFISPGTVKSHIDHIFEKLGARSRLEAVARYAEIENADTDRSSGSSA